MRTYMRKYKQTGLGALPRWSAECTTRSWRTDGRALWPHVLQQTLPVRILDAPDEFVTGLLQTYFDGDGNADGGTAPPPLLPQRLDRACHDALPVFAATASSPTPARSR